VTTYTEFSLTKLLKTNLRSAMTDDKLGTVLRTATTEEIPHVHMPHIYAAIFPLLKLTSRVHEHFKYILKYAISN
jgi:hypothetical protein